MKRGLEIRQATRADFADVLCLSANLKRERAHAFYESLGLARQGYSFRTDLQSVPEP